MFRVQATGRTSPPSIVARARRVAHVVINGKETRVPEGIRLQFGLKHLVAKVLYGKHIEAYQDAINRGELEEGARILGKIPRWLTDAFHDLDAIETSKRWA